MTNRKSQNSILLLATLGVYFGLVLAGATPQVLAHAATAKQFDLRDEIELTDDLDNKPNDCDLSQAREKILDYETEYLWFNARSISEYVHLVEQVLDAYSEKVDGIDVSWTSVGEFRPSRKVTTATAYPFGLLDAETSTNLDRDVLYVGNGLPGKSFTFSVFRNAVGNQFRFESQQIPYGSPTVRALYSSAFNFTRCYQSTEQTNLILRNSELTVEGDHLIIVTRLPRGSLDPLLASDAK